MVLVTFPHYFGPKAANLQNIGQQAELKPADDKYCSAVDRIKNIVAEMRNFPHKCVFSYGTNSFPG